MILLTVRRCCSHRDSLPLPDKNISVTENSSSREPHFCHKLLINASCTDRLQCQEQMCPERPSQHPLGITHPHWGLHYLSSCRKGMMQLDVNVVSQIVNLLCPPIFCSSIFQERQNFIPLQCNLTWMQTFQRCSPVLLRPFQKDTEGLCYENFNIFHNSYLFFPNWNTSHIVFS